MDLLREIVSVQFISAHSSYNVIPSDKNNLLIEYNITGTGNIVQAIPAAVGFQDGSSYLYKSIRSDDKTVTLHPSDGDLIGGSVSYDIAPGEIIEFLVSKNKHVFHVVSKSLISDISYVKTSTTVWF